MLIFLRTMIKYKHPKQVPIVDAKKIVNQQPISPVNDPIIAISSKSPWPRPSCFLNQ